MNRFSLLILPALLFIYSCGSKHTYAIVTTFAGSGTMGYADGKGTAASFANLMGIAADTWGNIYVADSHNNMIRKITPEGVVTTLAGNGTAGSADGKGAAATFFYPGGVAVDRNDNVYVADTHNSLIRRITPEGIVTTFAGWNTDSTLHEKDSAGRFDNPVGIAIDANGNIFVADWNNDVIKKINGEGKVTILAGSGVPGDENGPGTKASFYLPGGIAADSAGNLYVADTYNNMIRKISPGGMVTTLAGHKKKGFANGKDTAAAFLHPEGIAVDKKGNIIVADVGNNRIRKISPEGNVSTLAGSGIRGYEDGRDTTACFYRPYGVTVDKEGNIFVADYQNNLVRKISYDFLNK